jgi:hypothetical protein
MQHLHACRHCSGAPIPDHTASYSAALFQQEHVRTQIELIEQRALPVPFVCFMCSNPGCMKYTVLSYEFHVSLAGHKAYTTSTEYYRSLIVINSVKS